MVKQKEIMMNVIDYNVKAVEKGFELSIVATSPSPDWTHVGLFVINHTSAPEDGIQEIILEGTPPDNNHQLTDLEEHEITVFIKQRSWLKGIKIRNSFGDVIKTINVKVPGAAISKSNLTAIPEIKNHDYVFHQLHFAEPAFCKVPNPN